MAARLGCRVLLSRSACLGTVRTKTIVFRRLASVAAAGPRAACPRAPSSGCDVRLMVAARPTANPAPVRLATFSVLLPHPHAAVLQPPAALLQTLTGRCPKAEVAVGVVQARSGRAEGCHCRAVLQRLPSHWKRCCVVAASGGCEQQQQQEAVEDLWLHSVSMDCPGEQADAFVESLLCFGAWSCSVEDANAGTDEEEEMMHDGPALWAPQEERRLWKHSRVVALFPPTTSDDDILYAIRVSAASSFLDEATAAAAETAAAAGSASRLRVPPDDWVEIVKAQYKPVHAGDDVWVVPHWCDAPVELKEADAASALTVLLDPGLAFGTGEHPTTRLCLRWLRANVGAGDSVLDYGAGSGVLFVAALKLGATRAAAVDIDPLALSSCAHNASLNGIPSSSYTLHLSTEDTVDPLSSTYHLPGASFSSSSSSSSAATTTTTANPSLETSATSAAAGQSGSGVFDVVVANILLNPLLALSYDLCRRLRPGGRIGLSGILTTQVDMVVDAYRPYLADIAVQEEDGWALVSGTRSNN